MSINNVDDFISYLQTLDNDELVEEMKKHGITFKPNKKPKEDFYDSLNSKIFYSAYYKIMESKVFVLLHGEGLSKKVYIFDLIKRNIDGYIIQDALASLLAINADAIAFIDRYIKNNFSVQYKEYVKKLPTEYYE